MDDKGGRGIDCCKTRNYFTSLEASFTAGCERQFLWNNVNNWLYLEEAGEKAQAGIWACAHNKAHRKSIKFTKKLRLKRLSKWEAKLRFHSDSTKYASRRKNVSRMQMRSYRVIKQFRGPCHRKGNTRSSWKADGGNGTANYEVPKSPQASKTSAVTPLLQFRVV